LEEGIKEFDFDKNPLHASIQQHLEAYVPFFLARGWDINSRTQDDQQLTPLHVAMMMNRPTSCIKKLLTFGADVSLTDGNGSAAFHWGCRWNPGAISDLLDEGIVEATGAFKAVKARDKNGHTSLHLALIGHRNGFLSAKTLEAIIPSNPYRYPVLPYDARLPTGERPIDFLMDTLSREHDFSRLSGREMWWRSVLFGSTHVPSLQFFLRIPFYQQDTSGPVLFPGTEIGVLDSFLQELPSEKRSMTQFDDLIRLGCNLLWSAQHTLGLSELLGKLIEGQCSEFWANSPWGIISLCEEICPEVSVKTILFTRAYHCFAMNHAKLF